MSALTPRARIVRTAKRAIASTLYHTGVLGLLVRRRLGNRAIVVTYHRVLADGDVDRTWSHPAIVVRRETFERQMAALARHFRLLTLPSFLEHLESGRPFDGPSCLVTFDDGWLDTYTEAWPILRRHGVPAVVFVPADFLGTGRLFWQEHASALLWTIVERARHDRAFADRARAALAPFGLDAPLNAAAGNRYAVVEAIQVCKNGDPGSQNSPLPTLMALAERHGDGAGPVDCYMTWAQAREMAADGVAFGGHGVTHRQLGALPLAEAQAEVGGSRAALAEQLPGHVDAFCYPSGSWTPPVADAVRAAGFRAAFSTARGVTDGAANRFALPRVNIHENVTSSVPLFLARLTGVL